MKKNHVCLAIEGILAFFLEATFIGVMYFGWEKFGKRFHLASTWLAVIGATLSAWWILVANAWMQYPAGMDFNPDTARNELTNRKGLAEVKRGLLHLSLVTVAGQSEKKNDLSVSQGGDEVCGI